MRRELLFAIILGVLIGLIFAFGLYRANNIMKQKTPLDASSTQNQTSNTNDLKTFPKTLSLFKPSANQVFGNDTIQISGITKPQDLIVITGGTYDYVGKVSDDGTFDISYEIGSAINTLDINSISPDNTRMDSKINALYSSVVPQSPTSSVSDNTQDKAESKLKENQNIAQFYQGTITDLTDEGLQMKNTNSEIKLVSINKDTSFAKIGTTTTKLTISDIAIGDYVLALGYRQENDVLNAFRILVTQPQTPNDVKIFFGSVTDKNKSDLDVSQQSSDTINLTIDNNSKTYQGDLNDPDKVRFANIGAGDTVIGTYEIDKNKNVIRRLYILQSPTPTQKP